MLRKDEERLLLLSSNPRGTFPILPREATQGVLTISVRDQEQTTSSNCTGIWNMVKHRIRYYDPTAPPDPEHRLKEEPRGLCERFRLSAMCIIYALSNLRDAFPGIPTDFRQLMNDSN
ncbi:hypothetical protein FBUS_02971 [Fasciolopsis buskii]|uniref:Uncharacterized protein n=1 Tax=Fasciolopsis buskii TaxID=27845 RepID=A0A8E0RQQ1_9TREM|nr:hypothetical protein FBUS_02971 [Fasciolopsis buski]